MKTLTLDELINKYGDVVFDKVAELFNFVFEYKNEDYQPVDAEWIADNLSIRELGFLLEDILAMNRLEWLLPFFKEKFLEELNKA